MRESSTAESRPPQATAPPASERTRLGWLLDPGTAVAQGTPPLDPRTWTPRHRYFTLIGLAVAIVAGLYESVHVGPLTGGVDGIRTFLTVAFAVGLAGLALSLRGLTVPGLILGGVFIVAGMLSWAYTDTPIVVWLMLGLEGVLFAVWSFPWLRDLVRLPPLGAAWLGLAYWFLGILGALLVWHPKVAAQRIAYTGVFTLAALAVVVATRKSRKDMTVGVVAAFLLAFAVLFVFGSGNALFDRHIVPPNGWGRHMESRFWGGPGLLYHPNSIAVVAVLIAIRIGADRLFERWQRYAALAVVAICLLLVNSRTGVGYLGLAALVYAVLVWRRWRSARRGAAVPEDGLDAYPTARAAWTAALVPLVLVGVIAIGSGGAAFLTANRYSPTGDDMTSGRSATWSQVFKEFKADPIAEKVFGNARNARATVSRPGSGDTKLTTDNAAVGALRRGGILGEIAFLFGLGLLLWHGIVGIRRRDGQRVTPPAWFTVATVGSLFSIPFADWLLGTTGGTLWIFLLAGEAALYYGVIGDSSALRRR